MRKGLKSLVNSKKNTGEQSPASFPSEPVVKQKQHRTRWIMLILGLAAGLLIAVVAWLVWLKPPPITDPFRGKTLSSIDFPIYYPTRLPTGYKLDKKSVTEPQSGVLVVTLKSSDNQKIYISQERRPSIFDFGAYYNQFSDKKQSVISGTGTVAVGRINGDKTIVGSLATNKTWILTNTNAKVPLDQIETMLQNMAVSH